MGMTIDEALRRSGNAAIPLGFGAAKRIQKQLTADEEVFYAVQSNIKITSDFSNSFSKRNLSFGGAGSIKDKMSGIVVVTNHRIIFCSAITFPANEKEIPVSEIQSIDNTSSLMGMGQLRIQGLTEMFVIDIYSNRVMEEMKKAISAARASGSKNNSTTYIASLSPADELRKWKQLLDEGIITVEEFEKKKSELI